MKNKLVDLNNHLFAELERLGDEDLQGEDLDKELARAKGITSVSAQIVQNGNLLLKTAQFADQRFDIDTPLPKILIEDTKNEKL